MESKKQNLNNEQLDQIVGGEASDKSINEGIPCKFCNSTNVVTYLHDDGNTSHECLDCCAKW